LFAPLTRSIGTGLLEMLGPSLARHPCGATDQEFSSCPGPNLSTGFAATSEALRWRVPGRPLNLTDVRQTRWNPLLRPARGADGRWTVDAWAPLEGRVLNGGVRVRF